MSPSSRKKSLHPRNKHINGYDFSRLCEITPELTPYVFINDYQNETIDFSNNNAVLLLNKSLLITYYNLTYWHIPDGMLCPPIPGRADYIHYLADLLKHTNLNKIPHNKTIKVLDVGVGANCIYPIVGVSQYSWDFVGSDINDVSISCSNKIIDQNPSLAGKVEIRKQTNSHSIFKEIIKSDEMYDLTLCNPPFHCSHQESTKGSERKWKNLNKNSKNNTKNETNIKNKSLLNFGGLSNELWCEGGELNFINNMIKESVLYSSQVLWFTCLVSKKEHLRMLQLSLKKTNCSTVKVIQMTQGQKTSRFIAWCFQSSQEIEQWCLKRFNK